MICDFRVVLVAAGDGTRLGADVRKAAVPIAGRPIAVHSLEASMAHRNCVGAVLVVHPDDLSNASDWLRQAHVDDVPVEIVAGGRTRRDSVLAGLSATVGSPGELLVIHDGARPALHPEDLERVLETASRCQAAILARAVTDTLHRSDASGLWRAAVDRKGLWSAQTPQVFDLELIRNALAGSAGIVTDEVEAVASTGFEVQFVEPLHANPKVTTAADLERTEALLRQRC
jgi:2-C-methyl-D-erythritol 4-phosphate cytidylyltransferase